MKKKFLIGFIVVLFSLLTFGCLYSNEENIQIANLPINEIEERRDTFQDDNGQDGYIVTDVEADTKEETNNEETKIEVVSKNSDNKVTINSNLEPKEETKQEKDSNVKAEKNSATKVTTKETVIEQPKETTNKVTTPVENKETNNPKKETVKCTSSRHFMDIGNSQKWFGTEDEAITYYNKLIKEWGQKWENFEIDDKTYYANCPCRL